MAHEVVVIGGGFGGLQAALGLAKAPVRVTLVDCRNFHLFQPLLYQVATGSLSPANISVSLRAIFRRQRNARVLLGKVMSIDPAGRSIGLADGRLGYDTLILATGSQQHYFGHGEWARIAPGLKTVEDALSMRRKMFTAFELAERETDPQRRTSLMTFVIVGGGPTGVELAGALADIAHHGMTGEFRSIEPARSRIVLVEAGVEVLATYDEPLRRRAMEDLKRLGVEVMVSSRVIAMDDHGVDLHSAGGDVHIETETVLWGAGVMGSPLGRVLSEAIGVALERGARVPVGPDCAIVGHPEILVIGDLAAIPGPDGRPLPAIAQVAMQQGSYVARLVRSRLMGKTLAPFVYKDHGTMATIGKRAAVAQIGKLHLTGSIAWLAWLLIHIVKLMTFENRILVLIQWSWAYIQGRRSAGLITGEDIRTGAGDPQDHQQPARSVANAVDTVPEKTLEMRSQPGTIAVQTTE